jgi:hypothetical protein
MRRRKIAFAVLAAACLTLAVGVAAAAVLGERERRTEAARAAREAAPRAQQLLADGRPLAVVRSVDRSHAATFGFIGVAPVDHGRPGAPVLVGPPCQRVAFAAGRGLCLDGRGTDMAVELLDARLRVVRKLELAGVPSRARVSPDGRWGGVTAFIVGHAYAAPGQFSTATTLIDLRSGRPVANLEKDVRVTDHGRLVDARDRNYWGLTFAGDGDTFYATLATGGQTFLIRGSVHALRARVIHRNVECPSLSPDGTRIAYKKAVAHDPTVWRFHVLDLASGRETPLAETRSIDDQLAWLDDGHVLYGDGNRTWVVPADGTGSPRVWMNGAESATVSAGRGQT